MSELPNLSDIEVAAARIRPYIRETPVLKYQVEDAAVILKLELFQHAGTFKPRGAFNSVLTEIERGHRPRGLVAASGGNHGLAVAYVGRRLGVPTRIFVPAASPAVKAAGIAALGADLDQSGADYSESFLASVGVAAQPGMLGIHAYDSLSTVIGQGTLAAELDQQAPNLDTVLVAVGGGGLLAGVACWFGDHVQVVGVEPVTCPTLHEALRAGRPVDVQVGGVAADSLGAPRLGELAFAAARGMRVSSVLVDDEAIRSARRLLWEDCRVLAEPAGATALAGLTSGAYRPAAGERIGVIVCGGNSDPSTL